MSNLPGQVDPLDLASSTEAQATVDEHVAHRIERRRKLKLSLTSSLLTRPLSALIPLLAVRIFVPYLGKERYGLYEAVGSLALYFGMTNVGLTLGLINRLTDCQVSGDRLLARKCVSTLTLAMAVLTIVSIVVLSGLTPLLNWQHIFDLKEAKAIHEAPACFWVAGLCVITGLLSGTTSAVYVAYQETHINNIWDASAKVLSLGLCFFVPWADWGVVGMIIALSGAPSLVRCINLIDMFVREKPWLRPSLRLFEWSLLKSMAGQSILLFLLQMSTVLLFQSDKMVIGMVINAEAVTPYSVVCRIFLTAYGVYMMLLTPLWPAHGEAVRRGDLDWVKRNLRRSLIAGMLLMALTSAVVFFGGGPLFRKFSGGVITSVSTSLILAVTATFIVRAWVDCRSIILNSTNVLVPQICFYTSHAVTNLILAIILGRIYGVEGIAWATPMTGIVTVVWGYPWMTSRYIFGARKATNV